jgi:cytochrome c peroxidase
MVLGTMEASNVVVAASAVPMYKNVATSSGDFDTGGFMSPDSANFATPPMTIVSTDAGPRGVTFVGNEAYLHTFLDRTIGPLWSAQVSRDLGEQFAVGSISDTARAAPHGTSYGDSTLPADVLAGRKLFYSATSSVMAADGAGVSCSTCHYQGRNDGLTWSFRSGGRQTPSLAGHVTATAPFTWTSEVPSIADEATLTSQGRMGGDGLTRSDAVNIQAFVDYTRPVDLPLKGSDDAAVLRGKALFERADVGCATCHTGSVLTDNQGHTMFGLTGANTPTLVGIAATAPYLHDGSAASLMDVLKAVRNGEMGNTGMLSDAEMADLETYLKSL